MPVGHTPNGDHPTYLAHFESAVAEWVRAGVISLDHLVKAVVAEAGHPTPEALKAASEQSQDGSVAYNLNLGDGTVAVAPAIPHTEETAAAVNEAGGHAVPATTTTATAGSEQLADTSTTPEATPDNPEGGEGTGVLNEEQQAGSHPDDLLSPDEAAALQTDQPA